MRALALIAALSFSSPASSQPCPGDCDGGGVVDLAEIRLAVSIALRLAPLVDCEEAYEGDDDAITVDEIVLAVTQHLEACGFRPPTPTATTQATATPTGPTATATATAADTPTAGDTPLPTSTATPTATPGPPDLVPDRIVVVAPTPVRGCVDNFGQVELSLLACVRNDGESGSGAFLAEVGKGGGGPTIEVDYPAGVPRSSEVCAPLEFIDGPVGFEVDVRDEVVESDETNNIAVAEYPRPTLPPLCPTATRTPG